MGMDLRESFRVPGRRALYVWVAALVYTAVTLALFVRILRASGGHVLFTLDDSYIHLALAEQIARGTYGINPGEAASPSSSILWPYVLALFSGVSWQPYASLGLNFLFGLATSVLLGVSVADLPGEDESRGECARRLVTVAGLILVGNLFTLTFLGMEHTLEELLAVLCALGLVRAMRGQAMPWWCLGAAVVAPSVRYEALCVTVGVAVCLAGQGRARRALGVVTASLIPVAWFGVYLVHRGLPALPLSVLVKAGVTGASVHPLWGLLLMLRFGVHKALVDPERSVLGVLALTLAGLAWRERERGRRWALGGAAVAAGLHLLVGPFGWFHRYEVYVVLLSTVVVLAVLFEQARTLLGWYVLGLLALGGASITTTQATVRAAHDLYLQQYQMHRFVTEFVDGNVAVNDLGLVSYRRRAGQRVLDLEGLASAESARQVQKTPMWLEAVTREHDVSTVMMYATWFPHTPPDWTRLGVLCNEEPPVILGGDCVTYFATPLADVRAEQRGFAAFVRTLPAGIRVETGGP